LLVVTNERAPICQEVRARFAGPGMAGRVELLERCPRAQYFGYFHRVDIALDPFPFNGHTTTCDAVWMGVPVVMLAGDTYASRFGGSVLRHVGLEELITTSPQQYVETAVKLATDRPRLSRWRAELRARMSGSIITDSTLFTRRLESAYRQMWRDWCAGAAR
jgi:protein O-GlcNAc transferase